MIEIEREVLIILVITSFLAGILLTLAAVMAVKLKNISNRMKHLAERMGDKK